MTRKIFANKLSDCKKNTTDKMFIHLFFSGVSRKLWEKKKIMGKIGSGNQHAIYTEV